MFDQEKGEHGQNGGLGARKNCTLFVFDNTANGLSNSHVLNPVQTGETSIVVRFGQTHEEDLTVLIYGEFENLQQINSNKSVIYDVYRQ